METYHAIYHFKALESYRKNIKMSEPDKLSMTITRIKTIFTSDIVVSAMLMIQIHKVLQSLYIYYEQKNIIFVAHITFYWCLVLLYFGIICQIIKTKYFPSSNQRKFPAAKSSKL